MPGQLSRRKRRCILENSIADGIVAGVLAHLARAKVRHSIHALRYGAPKGLRTTIDMSHPAPDARDRAEPDLSGRTLGDYTLIRRLGQGAMAEVYLAEQGSLGRQVAFKVLKQDLSNDATYVKRFRLEAQAVASLIHTNIVQIYDVGHIDGVHFIAQEYVAGGNLRELIRREGPLPLRRAKNVMQQVASALAIAAERGIVHRDIKPENILLTHDDVIKVADFGLARRLQSGAAVDLTQVGITMGTPLYMSPEQIEGRSLDSRSDIYSFGVTCYHMLAGKPPFDGETPLAVAVQHLERTADRLESIRADVPSDVCRCVHRMLEKAPQDRFGSPDDVVRAIRRFGRDDANASDTNTVSSHTVGSPSMISAAAATQVLEATMRAETAVRPRRRWLRLVVVVLVGILFGVGLAWLGREPSLLDGNAVDVWDVPHKQNVQEQWLYALRSGSEGAWMTVVERFPDELTYVRHAEQELARIYLFEQRWEEALPRFNDFAKVGDDQPRLKAFGLAGKSVALCYDGRYEESSQAMRALEPLVDHVHDRALLELVDFAREANRKALDVQQVDRLKQRLKDRIEQMDTAEE